MRLFHFFATLALVVILNGCSAPPPRPYIDQTGGLSSTDQLYAKAYTLWGYQNTCSDPEHAIDLLDESLKLSPNNAKSLLLRGRACTQLGRIDEALKNITDSLCIQATAETYAWRAYALLHEQNIRGAKSDLEYALRLDKSCSTIWGVYGVLYLMENDEKQALKAFNKASSKGDSTWLEKFGRSTND